MKQRATEGSGARRQIAVKQLGELMPSTHTLEKKDAMMGCGGGAAAGRGV